jgi:hypothetical protein
VLEPQVGSAEAALGVVAAIIDSLASSDRLGIISKHPEQEHASYQALPLLSMTAANKARARAVAEAISRQQLWGFSSAQGFASGIAGAEQQLLQGTAADCSPGRWRQAVVCIASARYIKGGPRAWLGGASWLGSGAAACTRHPR